MLVRAEGKRCDLPEVNHTASLASRMDIPLEDTAADIVGKVQRGLGISDSQLAAKAGLDVEQVRRLRDGEFDDAALAAVAPVLCLDADSLTKLARNKWEPERVEAVAG